MNYRVVITEAAKEKLEQYIWYTSYVLKNKEAAQAIFSDAQATEEVLVDVAESNPFCSNPILFKHGYRKQFFLRHRFVMIYRMT